MLNQEENRSIVKLKSSFINQEENRSNLRKKDSPVKVT